MGKVERMVWTIAEAAREAGVSEIDIMRAIRAKELRGAKLGNSYRISKLELAKWQARTARVAPYGFRPDGTHHRGEVAVLEAIDEARADGMSENDIRATLISKRLLKGARPTKRKAMDPMARLTHGVAAARVTFDVEKGTIPAQPVCMREWHLIEVLADIADGAIKAREIKEACRRAIDAWEKRVVDDGPARP